MSGIRNLLCKKKTLECDKTGSRPKRWPTKHNITVGRCDGQIQYERER